MDDIVYQVDGKPEARGFGCVVSQKHNEESGDYIEARYSSKVALVGQPYVSAVLQWKLGDDPNDGWMTAVFGHYGPKGLLHSSCPVRWTKGSLDYDWVSGSLKITGHKRTDCPTFILSPEHHPFLFRVFADFIINESPSRVVSKQDSLSNWLDRCSCWEGSGKETQYEAKYLGDPEYLDLVESHLKLRARVYEANQMAGDIFEALAPQVVSTIPEEGDRMTSLKGLIETPGAVSAAAGDLVHSLHQVFSILGNYEAEYSLPKGALTPGKPRKG